MKYFTNNKVAIAISTALLLSSTSAFSAGNLVTNGDFEDADISGWILNADDVNDLVLSREVETIDGQSTHVLKTTGRIALGKGARYILQNVVAGETYTVEAKAKSTAKVRFGFSYFKNDEDSTFQTVEIGVGVVSKDQWVNVQQQFTLPADADTEKAVKIFMKTGNVGAGGDIEISGETADTYLDDFFVRLPSEGPSRHSIPGTYTDNATNAMFWTAHNILEQDLDIMRLQYSDTLGTGTGGTFVNNASIDTFLIDNPDWRYATPQEMTAIFSFFDASTEATLADNRAINIANFKALFGAKGDGTAVWSPSQDGNKWLAGIPTTAQADGDPVPLLSIIVNESGTFTDSVYYADRNVGAEAVAALLVRTADYSSRLSVGDSTYSNDVSNEFWTANSINGSCLDIMRLSVSDNYGGDNANFTKVETELAAQTEANKWRYATEEEMQGVRAFFDLSNNADNSNKFEELFGTFKTFTNSSGVEKTEWYALIPDTPVEGSSPSIGINVNETYMGPVSNKANFNVNSVSAAALLVRDYDTDADTVVDSLDAFSTDASASIDTDSDGKPDELNTANPGCDTDCIATTTLVVDTDDDNDGVLDTHDAFSTDASASIDTDLDGKPDQLNATNPGCDTDCIVASTLVVDTDDDNDSVLDTNDAFSTDASASIDTDLDGKPDELNPVNPGCDTDCINASTLAVDIDDDNDGIIDSLDDFPLDGDKSTDQTPAFDAIPTNISLVVTDSDSIANSDEQLFAFLAITATDAEDGNITVNNNAPTAFPVGDTDVTFTATDTGGTATGAHPISATVTVTVEDKGIPLIALKGESDITLTVGEDYTDAGVIITDNADADIASRVVTDLGGFDQYAPNEYTISYNVTDASGNIADEVIRTVTVEGSVKPIVNKPNNIEVDATDENGTSVTKADIATFLTAVSAKDIFNNTVEVMVTIDGATIESTDVLPRGETTVTFTATDSAGNTTVETATITVTDLSAPVITLLGGDSIIAPLNGDYTETGYTDTAGEFVTLGIDTVTDNIDVIDVSAITDIVSTVDLTTEGTYTVTYSVSDVSGNQGTATRTVVVQDAAAPKVSAPESITVEATSATGTANTDVDIVAFLAAATAIDAVDGSRPVTTVDAPDTFALGATDVTFSSTDTEGYTGTSIATITVVDTTSPDITLTGDSAITLSLGAVYTEQGATATDIVDGNVAVVVGGDTVDTSVQKTYTLTYAAVDDAGNAAEQITRLVTVQDASAPVITPPANITIAAIDSKGTALSDSAFDGYFEQASAVDDINGVVSVTNDAPNVFPIGITTVTFTAEDATGNEGTTQTTVTIADQTAPVITLIGDSSVTLTVDDAYTDLGATALDNVDGDVSDKVEVTGTLDVTTAGSYTLTYSVTDAATNLAEVVTREITIIASDRDGDGVIDELDAFPNDASETIDTDEDGTGDNADVFPNDPTQQVTDIIAPVFAEDIATIILDATGIETSVEQAVLDSNIVAIDGVDGEIDTVIDTQNLVLVSGKHTVTLSATDTKGNVATTEVAVHINPIVELGGNAIVEAGSQLTVPVKLSGAAANYPVVIDYSVTSTTGSTPGSVTIEQDGIAGEFTVTIDANAQTGNEVVISLTKATNAVAPETTQLIANVKNASFAPTFDVSIKQAEQTISTISPNSGLVTVTADISDINTDDQHDVTFEVINTAFSGVVSSSEASTDLGNVFTFDPAGINTGKYQLKITVAENNSDELLSTEIITSLYIDAAQTEIIADSDQDGIPDSLDNDSDTSRIPVANDEQPLQVQAGLRIVLGELAQGTDSASIPEELIIEDTGFEAALSITSFEIKGLSVTGDSVAVILPLPAGASIPEDAIYRKFTEVKGWFDFVEDEKNSLNSALRDVNGNCPSPTSDAYKPGLLSGNSCIQLIIEDGGPNDADGLANGVVADPGVMVVQAENIAPTITVESVSAFSNADVKVTATATDYDSDNISYTWEQVAGPSVELTIRENHIFFTAPTIQGQLGGLTLAFEVTANDGTTTSTETVEVDVSSDPDAAPAKSSGGSLGFWSMLLLGLGLTRRTKK